MSSDRANHHGRGRLLFDQERWALSADAFAAHLATQPNDPGAHAMRAIALAKASPKNGAAARAASDESLRLDANSAYCLYARAIVALHADVVAGPIGAAVPARPMTDALRLRASRHFAQLAIAADSSHLPTWRLLARIALSLNEPATMRGAAEQALRLAPTDPAGLALRARSFEIGGQATAALAAADEGLAIAPNDATLQSVRAWALLQVGKDAAAEQGFVESLRIDPTDNVTQKGLDAARHNLKTRARWWQFRLVDKPRRLRSNQIAIKKASPWIGVVVAASVALNSLSRVADTTPSKTSTSGEADPYVYGLVALVTIIVVLIVFFRGASKRK